MTDIHVDFEWFSDVEIRRGPEMYFGAAKQGPLMCSFAADGDATISRWLPGQPCPPRIVDHARAGGRFVAHNAGGFERHAFKTLHRDHGWPEVRLEQWRCTMASACAMGLPADLETLAEALGLVQKKDKRGKALIKFFCVPRADGLFNEPRDFPEKFAIFQDYCDQDVRTEMAVDARLVPLSDDEQAVWEMDQRINDRGVRVDRASAFKALEIIEKAKATADARMREATGGVVPTCNSNAKLLAWIEAQGVAMDGVAKDDVLEALDLDDLPEHVAKVLKIRQVAAKSSTAKIGKMLYFSEGSGRIKNRFRYHGTHPGRWTCLDPGLFNLPRPRKEYADAVEDGLLDVNQSFEIIRTGEPSALEAAYGADLGSPLEFLSDSIRGFLTAAPGRELIAVDYSSIQGCLAAWFAGETWKLQAIQEILDDPKKPDLYRQAAAKILGLHIDVVTKKHWARQAVGKTSELACMSASTLVLTSTGVKPIVEVLLTDKLWDGLTWVTHSGVLDKGVRPVVDVDGIELTEDHLVLVRRTWRKARQLASSEIILCSALETGSASLPWSKSCEAPQAEFMASWLHVLAEANRTPRTKACFALVNQHGADCAPEPKHQRPGNLISPTMTSFLMTLTGEDFLTASRRALIDAQIRTIKAFQTMGAEASEYTGVKIVDRFSSIWSRLKVGTTLLWNLIAKKLTTITDPEIFVSSHAQRTHETEERCRVFKTTSGSCENASQNLKPVFDIANAGPNNRFAVVSKSGFLIVHNCGFQGGVPSLVSMAANYGIRRRQLHDLFPGIWAGATEANREYAAKRYEKVRKSRQKQHSDTLTREAWIACSLIVRGWRQTNHEIEVSWTTLETAVRNAVREPGKVVTTLRGVQYLVKNGYLWCRLPSGRCIAYGSPKLKDQVWARLRLEDLSWGEAEVVDGEEARSLARQGRAKIEGETSPKVTVLGVEQRKLVRYALYGGLLMENLCLGAEADILRVGMQNCERNGRDVVYHCYDELVVEVPFGTCSVEEIVEYALDLPAWTEGLPLGAAGWRGKRYHK